MQIDSAFTMPLADIFIFGAIIFFAFSGFMRGALRALFSSLRVYFSFIITALLYERVAVLLQVTFDMPSWLAQMICFITIFGVILATAWILGAILVGKTAKTQQTGGSLDRIGGSILGLMEGILMVSIIIMWVDFHPMSTKAHSPFENAISYKAVKQIAPGIKEFTVRPLSRLKKESNTSEPEDS